MVWKKDPEFKAVYDEFDTEFALLRQLLALKCWRVEGHPSRRSKMLP